MNTHRILTPERAASTEGTRVQLRVIHPDPQSARRHRSEGDWFLALMYACLALFVVALVMYVVNPAVRTVTSGSAEAWNSGETLGTLLHQTIAGVLS
jgi:hypothetical protein